MTEIKKSGGNFDEPIIAGDEAERFAVVRAEQEDIPRMPETPEEMVEATLEPVTGCLDQILLPLSRASVGNVSGLQDILLQINMRLLVYLKSEATVKKKKVLIPSAYARHVLSASSGLAPTDQVVAIADITAHIVAELNPLMHAAWKEYDELIKDMDKGARVRIGIPVSIEEFFELLNVGKINSQKVVSFFGVLKEISSEHATVPFLDSRTPELPKEIVLTDPFGDDQKEYWLSRQRAYTALFHQDISRQQLINSKNTAVLYDLSQIVVQSSDEELKEAVQNIGSWLEGEHRQVEGMTDDEFVQYVLGLHFAYGDAATLIELLNSLEIVKQKEPELYVRILGRAPRPLSQADARSDLFGNLLQAAIYRSLHMETGKGTEEYGALQSFLTGLTRMETHQDTTAPLSDEEFESMEKLFTDYVEQQKMNREADEGSLVSLLVPGLLFGEKKRAYQMGKMLERVSAKNREGLLQELRSATPNEFVMLMNSKRLLPKGLRHYDVHELPPDVKMILEMRGLHIQSKSEMLEFIFAIESVRLMGVARTMNHEFFRFLGTALERGVPIYNKAMDLRKMQHNVRDASNAVELRNDVIATLWKTTPSEKLLKGDEFYDYFKKATDTLTELHGKIEKCIKSYEAQGFEIDKTRPIQDKEADRDGHATPSTLQQMLNEHLDIKEAVRDLHSTMNTILQILNVHQDITVEQWRRWLQYFRALGPGDHQMFAISAKDVLKQIFQSIGSAEQILQSPSKFWRLGDIIFPRLLGEKEEKITEAMNVSPDDAYAFIIGTRSVLESPDFHDLRSTTTSQDDLIRRGLSPDDNLTEPVKNIIKNYKLFSKLFSPVRCADILESYFKKSGNAPGIDIFCDMLSQEDRESFLSELGQKQLKEMRSEFTSGRIVTHGQSYINFLFVLFRAYARAIPEYADYLELKKIISAQKGYMSNTKDSQPRRVRYDDEHQCWILEEGRLITMGEGEYSWQGIWNNALQVMKNELEWTEIARG